MATPKTRDRENRRPTARVKTLTLECRTARDLLKDGKGRVETLVLSRDGSHVVVTLTEGWEFPSSLPQSDYTPERDKSFTLWEAARNAVRRAIKVE